MIDRFRSVAAVSVALVIAWGFTVSSSRAATLPPGFIEEGIGEGWAEATGITFAANGRLFGWERAGRVWMLDDTNIWHLVVDIHQECGGWRDFGLLGCALHPNFMNNGQIFLLYSVDRHHLLNFGTPNYNPNADEYFNAHIGRITRYTLDANQDWRTTVPGSRVVLFGESVSTGMPSLHESHGIGSLVFGNDGTLLASLGDGASYNGEDYGNGNGGAYAIQAMADGIITPAENVGVFRSQMLSSFNGKIIRIDPDTGDGIPSNPFYDPLNPRSAKSRTWALGLRNPCRMTIRPGTGSHNPADANPGALYLGDVGWDDWEELNVCNAPGQNFGWPLYEGMNLHADYSIANMQNPDAPNPLGGGGCPQNFYFRNLIVQDTLNPNPSFPNPCNVGQQIPANIPKFVHRRPVIDWGRPNGPARVAIYNGNNASTINVGAGGSPVSGSSFGGNCSIGGVWYTGTSYPVQYRNTYFHVDYGQQWIRSFTFDANNKPTGVQTFMSAGGELVAMAAHPITGDLYYSNWGQVYRIRYQPGGNQAPLAVASANVTYGPGPLTVQFTGSGSSDPNNQNLSYAWNFGDGGTSTQANPQHTFNAPVGVPTQFNVTLTVTDTGSLTNQTSLIISVNNTPPVIAITSPAPGSTYLFPDQINYPLRASVVDAEHSAAQLTCQWQTVLHHNNHTHSEPFNNNCVTSTVISPVGCDGNTYFYRIHLKVTDAAGLSSTAQVDINPFCGVNTLPTAGNDAAEVDLGAAVDIPVLINDFDSGGSLNPATVAIIQAPLHGSAAVNPANGNVTYTHNNSPTTTDSFTYTVNDNNGGTSNLATVDITILPENFGDVTGDGFVNVQDLLFVIGAWGPCPVKGACPADIAPIPGGDNVVNVADLLAVIANWG